MKLYHGTSAKALDSILSQGLLPREKSKGNWEHTICSRDDCVYLTSIYAPYFGINAAEDNQFSILEVETDFLEYDFLLPDEDFLEQATRGQEPKASMEERTKFFRDSLHLYAEHWEKSVLHMGTCCYQDRIDPSAITRAVRVDGKLCQFMLGVAMDPMISIMNHKFCADKYAALTKWFMGDKTSPMNIFSFGKEHWDMIPDNQKDYLNKIMDDRSMIQAVL